jgi:hypothetical protein
MRSSRETERGIYGEDVPEDAFGMRPEPTYFCLGFLWFKYLSPEYDTDGVKPKDADADRPRRFVE